MGVCLPDVHGIDELKQWLIQVWSSPDQEVIHSAIDLGVKRVKHMFLQRAFILSTPYELAQSDRIDFV